MNAVVHSPEPMRIGYFGGSFDPPHRGHLAVARAARDRFALDLVLLAPTARQPLKPNGPEASFADRLRMTQLLCAGEPGVPREPGRWGEEPGVPREPGRWGGEPGLGASAIDGPQPDGQPNYTVDTLRRLHATLSSGCDPRRGPAISAAAPQIFAILGADAFLGLRQWREPEELLRLADWIIVSRPGFPLPAPERLTLTPTQRTRIHPLQGPADPTSATSLRARLHAGESCAELLPPAVLEYIQQHRLYRS